MSLNWKDMKFKKLTLYLRLFKVWSIFPGLPARNPWNLNFGRSDCRSAQENMRNIFYSSLFGEQSTPQCRYAKQRISSDSHKRTKSSDGIWKSCGQVEKVHNRWKCAVVEHLPTSKKWSELNMNIKASNWCKTHCLSSLYSKNPINFYWYKNKTNKMLVAAGVASHSNRALTHIKEETTQVMV